MKGVYMKKSHMILCALIAFGAFSCSADDDSWTGFQDGQFETIGDDEEGDSPEKEDSDSDDGDDDDKQDEAGNVTLG